MVAMNQWRGGGCFIDFVHWVIPISKLPAIGYWHWDGSNPMTSLGSVIGLAIGIHPMQIPTRVLTLPTAIRLPAKRLMRCEWEAPENNTEGRGVRIHPDTPPLRPLRYAQFEIAGERNSDSLSTCSIPATGHRALHCAADCLGTGHNASPWFRGMHRWPWIGKISYLTAEMEHNIR